MQRREGRKRNLGGFVAERKEERERTVSCRRKRGKENRIRVR